MYPQQQGYFGGTADFVPPVKRRSRRWLFVGLGVFGLVALLGVLAAVSTTASSSPAQKFAAQFAKYYAAGNSTATFAMLHPDTATTETIDGWAAKIAATKPIFAGAKPVFFREEQLIKGSPNGPSTEYFIVRGTDANYTFTIYVMPADGKLYVRSFTSATR
jgi:hypothetical protein